MMSAMPNQSPERAAVSRLGARPPADFGTTKNRQAGVAGGSRSANC